MTPVSSSERASERSGSRRQSQLGWLATLLNAITERGRRGNASGAAAQHPIDYAKLLAESLISERGEASGAAIARELLGVVTGLNKADRAAFFTFLGDGFLPDATLLRAAAASYIAEPDAENAARLAACAEPPRQELLRRMNMAPGATASLISLRRELLEQRPVNAGHQRLDADLRHLLSSWFNRGFLELRRIDWQTPAAILEKLIAYEAVHEIQDWQDLRRRLAADRRCFGFFHPALPGEPLIFVEVALVKGLAGSVTALLDQQDEHEAVQHQRAKSADTAIFYSISNCQDGLRGISFGNMLIKQVVEELQSELPNLAQFATLSPVPGFRRWLEGAHGAAVLAEIGDQDDAGLIAALADPAQPVAGDTQIILSRLCARYLTATPAFWRIDPVAKFHLGNGARLERINAMANSAPRGMAESYGIMVNYLYDLPSIEENHEDFTRDGYVHRGPTVEALLSKRASKDKKR